GDGVGAPDNNGSPDSAHDGNAAASDEAAGVNDYYVDINAAPGGDGSSSKPFRTITAAIDAYASMPGRPRLAHVAGGSYDAGRGERFPLILRGLSLEGAGQDQTIIVGTGLGGPDGTYWVTLVVGDGVLPTRIANLSVQPPEGEDVGILCDS